MTAALILWGHALAALLFGALGVAELRREERRWPRATFASALLLTALWALAVAGIEAGDAGIRMAELARDIAWLCFAAALVRRAKVGGVAVTALYMVVIGIVVVAAAITLVGDEALTPASLAAVSATHRICRMMALMGGLLLLLHLAQATAGRACGDQRLVVLALAAMWSIDLLIVATAVVEPAWPAALAVVRGGVMVGVAVLLAAAIARDEAGAAPAISRSATLRVLGTLAVLLYAAITAIAADLAAGLVGAQGRLVQTAIVFGATAALLTLASTPWLRAWTRVKLAKHLFSHRYDYRVEWQRFTATLGAPVGDAVLRDDDALGVRIVRAVADLTDSPAGLLLRADDTGLELAAAWNWPGAAVTGGAGFTTHLATGHIVALDAVRAGEEGGDVPPALLADRDAWVVVPLLHGDTLAGAIVLARPPVAHPLDWEDLDLLRVAGRQAASYLAEDRAHAALADAARFDEFNRRFAFLLHDIKNVASQLSLVARNAERHADNPDFRTDMIATLRDSAGRMTALLARLGEHDASRVEPLQPVDIVALVTRVTVARRAQHPVDLVAPAASLALAQPGRLEQALGHLLQNAAEASDPAVPVMVSVSAGSPVAITVADRGCGMAPGFVRDRLFRPFASSKPGGFGIGAFEARQIVRAMGGVLEVESREGEGTVFRILLPVALALEVAA